MTRTPPPELVRQCANILQRTFGCSIASAEEPATAIIRLAQAAAFEESAKIVSSYRGESFDLRSIAYEIRARAKMEESKS